MRPTPNSAFVSIPAIVARQAAAHAGDTIMRRKDRGIWKAITWAHLAEQVKRIGGAVLGAQIARGDTAAIISETRPEAAYADLAIQGAGAASIVIHPEETADRIEHILRSSGCRLLFVESEEQLDKVLGVRERCPALSSIIIFDMKGLREFAGHGCMSLDAFVSGCPADVNWDGSVDSASPDQPAIVLFARDETGSPGRTLSHGDVARMIGGAGARLMFRQRDERLAVLRMSDITERMWGLYLALGTGCVSNYLESPETAIENLQELQPTCTGRRRRGVGASACKGYTFGHGSHTGPAAGVPVGAEGRGAWRRQCRDSWSACSACGSSRAWTEQAAIGVCRRCTDRCGDAGLGPVAGHHHSAFR